MFAYKCLIQLDKKKMDVNGVCLNILQVDSIL